MSQIHTSPPANTSSGGFSALMYRVTNMETPSRLTTVATNFLFGNFFSTSASHRSASCRSCSLSMLSNCQTKHNISWHRRRKDNTNGHKMQLSVIAKCRTIPKPAWSVYLFWKNYPTKFSMIRRPASLQGRLNVIAVCIFQHSQHFRMMLISLGYLQLVIGSAHWTTTERAKN